MSVRHGSYNADRRVPAPVSNAFRDTRLEEKLAMISPFSSVLNGMLICRGSVGFLSAVIILAVNVKIRLDKNKIYQ